MSTQPSGMPTFIPFMQGDTPLSVASIGNRLFVGDQKGVILEKLADRVEPFIELDTIELKKDYDERGLLDLVSNDGKLYAYHTHTSGKNRLVELTLDKQGRTLFETPQAKEIHQGGRMAFYGGMLYLTVGDGGPQEDPNNNAQDLESCYGKILRFDLSKPDLVPDDNPFKGRGGYSAYVYAYGLRNPWGIGFAVSTTSSGGVGYVSDAGYKDREEINQIIKGANYGWNIKEGTKWSTFRNPVPRPLYRTEDPITASYVDPIYEYETHKFPALDHYPKFGVVIGGKFMKNGEYIFGDLSNVVMVKKLDGKVAMTKIPFMVKSFSQDEQGNVYLCAAETSALGKGIVYLVQT